MRTSGCDDDCITSFTIPQILCLAPSSRPPIEPVVSSTKTISSVGLVPVLVSVKTGGMTGSLVFITQAAATLTPMMNVRRAVERRNANECMDCYLLRLILKVGRLAAGIGFVIRRGGYWLNVLAGRFLR